MFRSLETILFDFDGVITDSVNVKTKAFANIYEPYGKEIVDKVIKHHLANGGVSRFKKFKVYHKDFLGIDLSNKQIQKMAAEFHDIVVQKVIDAPFIPGALEFIKKHYRDIPLYIISATPYDEINEIVNKKQLKKYFNGIYGSPTNKIEWVESIINKNHYKRNSVVFIGDALADYEAAEKNKIHFIARVDVKENNIFNNKNISGVINNLFELDKIIHFY